MQSTVASMIRMGVRVALESDESLARQVKLMDDEVDVLELEAMNLTVITVMRYAPVAGDLKFLTATLGVVGELEKAGDDAEKLARRNKKIIEAFPEDMKQAIYDLGEAVVQILNDAVSLYSDYSDEKAKLVIDSDTEINSGYKNARNNLLRLIASEPTLTKPLYRCIEAFHALEHAADHAVDIAKRMRTLHYTPPTSTGTPSGLPSDTTPSSGGADDRVSSNN
jgi:phosphate transport system protein